MSEYQGSGVERYECYRALLIQLPGIFAAGIRMDEENNLREIHILASSERNPKQISRDIQSALFAAYGLDIDHRIIRSKVLRNPSKTPSPRGSSSRTAFAAKRFPTRWMKPVIPSRSFCSTTDRTMRERISVNIPSISGSWQPFRLPSTPCTRFLGATRFIIRWLPSACRSAASRSWSRCSNSWTKEALAS